MEETHGKDTKRYVIALAAIFNEEGKILLTQRDLPDHPFSHGKWQLPGGGVEHTEHPKAAVEREIKEEIGNVKVRIIDQPYVISATRNSGKEHIIGITYPAIFEGGDIDISKDGETGDFKWVETEAIDENNTLEQVKNIVDASKKVLQTWKKH